jgi:hypothetical protein
MIRIISVMVLCLFTMTSVYGADRPKAKEQDDLPYSFRLHSQSGDETFQADCTYHSSDTVICHFLGVRINAGGETEMASVVQGFRELAPQEQKQVQEGFAEDSADRLDTIKGLQDQLGDPMIGPKRKDTIRELLSAYQSGDFQKSIEAMARKDKRTCSVDTQSFSLDFKRIGTWKWVSNPGPGGLCNFVKVYELLGEPLRGDDGKILTLQWKMTETRVVADTTRPLCEGAEKELNKPTVWSWRYPDEYELSCDFVTFRSLAQR